jgi:hypothetical protein
MKYVVLIYSNEAEETQEAAERTMPEYFAYNDLLRSMPGQPNVSEALQPSSTATTIRVRNGKTLTTDGPFVESKEQLGGFYLIDAANLADAAALAAKCPGAKYGTIELRPCVDFSQMS